MRSDELMEFCAGVCPENREEVLLFVRLLVDVPEFSAELYTLAAPGELIPPLDVTETLMEKYKGRLPV